MKRIALLFILFAAASQWTMAQAQEGSPLDFRFAPGTQYPPEKRWGIKLGNASSRVVTHSTFLDTTLNIQLPYKITSYKLFSLSPALQRYAQNGNIHEFSIRRLSSQSEDLFQVGNNGVISIIGKFRQSEIQLGYSYFVRMAKKWESPFRVFMGVEALPYYERAGNYSLSTTFFPTRSSRTGMQLAFSPRLAWYSPKNFFFDLSYSLNVWDLHYKRLKESNPNQPSGLNLSNEFSFNMLPGSMQAIVSAGILF